MPGWHYAGDHANGGDTTCDVTECKENERVVSNVCIPCDPGTTNAAGDQVNGGDTTCDVTECKENERVVSNTCVPCPAGSMNAANDDAM